MLCVAACLALLVGACSGAAPSPTATRRAAPPAAAATAPTAPMQPTSTVAPAAATGIASAAASPPQPTVVAASTPQSPPSSPAPPFGVAVRGEVADAAVRALVMQAGVRWVRTSVNWSAVEPSPGAYNWTAFDGHMLALGEMGVIPVVYVAGNPAWAASSRCGPIDRVPLSDFARFVTTLAQRFNGKTVVNGRTLPAVNHWQFYNEPDNAWTSGQASGFDGCWGQAGAAYAQMLAAAWDAVHAANPQAKVVFGGVAGESVDCPAGWECAGKPIFNFNIDGGDFVDDVLAYMDAHTGSRYFDIFDFTTSRRSIAAGTRTAPVSAARLPTTMAGWEAGAWSGRSCAPRRAAAATAGRKWTVRRAATLNRAGTWRVCLPRA